MHLAPSVHRGGSEHEGPSAYEQRLASAIASAACPGNPTPAPRRKPHNRPQVPLRRTPRSWGGTGAGGTALPIGGARAGAGESARVLLTAASGDIGTAPEVHRGLATCSAAATARTPVSRAPGEHCRRRSAASTKPRSPSSYRTSYVGSAPGWPMSTQRPTRFEFPAYGSLASSRTASKIVEKYRSSGT